MNSYFPKKTKKCMSFIYPYDTTMNILHALKLVETVFVGSITINVMDFNCIVNLLQ